MADTAQSGKTNHPGGRPRKWTDLEAYQARIDEYFEWNPETPTICGLALHLDFESRTSVLDYAARDDEFSTAIKKALLEIESRHEGRMYEGKPTGSIFWLKNRGWRDTQDHRHEGNVIMIRGVEDNLPDADSHT